MRQTLTQGLATAVEGATFLLNSAYGPDEVWGRLPVDVQRTIVERELRRDAPFGLAPVAAVA